MYYNSINYIYLDTIRLIKETEKNLFPIVIKLLGFLSIYLSSTLNIEDYTTKPLRGILGSKKD